MASQLANVFKKANTAFVAYTMGGFPSVADSVPVLLALQNGGADIIELGFPFTDPLADGPVIQYANQKALENGVQFGDCLNILRNARQQGLTTPVVMMGYYNTLLQYGETRAVQDASIAGANGFIVVDLPPEEAVNFRDSCRKYNISFIPLACPTTSDGRLKQLAAIADTFIYCVSINGITGERTELPPQLPAFIKRIRSVTSLPLAVGFGISNREQFNAVAELANGVVIGSAIVRTLDKAQPGHAAQAATVFAKSVLGRE
jgi:tryptophan synthase